MTNQEHITDLLEQRKELSTEAQPKMTGIRIQILGLYILGLVLAYNQWEQGQNMLTLTNNVWVLARKVYNLP